MSELWRLLQIFRIIIRYRLDTLLESQNRPLFLRCILFFVKFKSAPEINRGARLRKACEDLGPIFIKFGQLLSTRPDLIPADIVKELDQLQDNVPPFANDTFRALVESALGAPVEDIFATFSIEPLASASVAQVHAATLKSGEDVVVKIIRPGIENIIEQDLGLLQIIARLIARFSAEGKRLRPEEVVEDYRHTIFDELNLQREAANASQLRRNFATSPLLYVPEVYWDYCRRDIMVMERIYGIPVSNIAELEAQNTDMKLLAERGVEIFFTQVFDHNFFHADMHPGNIFVAKNTPERPQYIAVDLAIVGVLTREDQYYLARNLLAMFRRDYRQVAELHVQSGWVPKGTRINEFEAAIRSVCEPIFEKPLKDISFGQVLVSLFQTARRFDMEVQPQLVLLQKTLLNIEGLGRQLYPDLDLWGTAHPYLERWLENRFHPKSLWGELKRHGPEWMESFPMVPHLIFNALDRIQGMSDLGPELQQTKQLLAKQQQASRRHRSRLIIAGLALTGAAVTAWPGLTQQLSQLPPQSLLLVSIGALALILR